MSTLAELQRRIEELESNLAAADRRIEQFGERGKKAADGVRDFNNTVHNLNGAIDGFLSVGAKGNAQIGGMSDAFGKFGKVVGASSDAISKTLNAIGSLAGKLPVIGTPINTFANAVGGVTSALGTMTSLMTDGFAKMVDLTDAPSRGIRQFDQDMFNLHKRFGGTIGEAQKFADSLKLAGGTDFAKQLHLTTNEMSEFVRTTIRTSLTQEQLSKTVNTGVGAVKLYAAATAFAKSANIDAGTAAGLMNTLMNEQGQTAQEATNTLGLYIGVAEETGLAIDKVASSLNGAINSFAKIGMTADFGTPILKGFAQTMTDMGLGIENSIGLSKELTQQLAGLGKNYEMAYLTFQRGGLEMGGSGSGGALSAGIALQAAYLDANKTGDQADISNKLVRGMRDTLASFTGGDIVTVQQANQDPSMANQYYVQQQMLRNQFGITDSDSAARVLDMLSKLDEATRTGDGEAQKKLAKQIEEEAKGRDANLDIMEKMNRKLEVQINLMNVNARTALTQTRLLGALAADKVANTFSMGRALAEEGIKGGEEALRKIAEKAFGDNTISEALQSTALGGPGSGSPAAAPAFQTVGPMNALRADANMMARRGTSNAAIHQMMEKYLGRNLGSNSEVMTSEIDRVAAGLARVAAPGDVGQGGREGLAIEYAEQIKKALEGWQPRVEVGISQNAQGLIQIRDDAQQVAAPGSR